MFCATLRSRSSSDRRVSAGVLDRSTRTGVSVPRRLASHTLCRAAPAMRFSARRDVSAVPTGLGSIFSGLLPGAEAPLFHCTQCATGRCLSSTSPFPAMHSLRAMPPIIPWKSGPLRAALRAPRQTRPLGPVSRFGILAANCDISHRQGSPIRTNISKWTPTVSSLSRPLRLIAGPSSGGRQRPSS